MQVHTKARGDRTEAHDGVFLRVQAKTGRLRDGVIRFNTCSSTAHHRRAQESGFASQDYRGEADCFAVHCAQTGAVYMVPVDEVGMREASLRVAPVRNGQRAGIRFATDYQIHPPG